MTDPQPPARSPSLTRVARGDLCAGCGACAGVAPAAIRMEQAAPGFLRDVPAAALAEYPRWLKALVLRAERAQRDPTRDQARMLELKPFADALATADPADADAQALRWELQELRVQLFAQELGVKGGVSPKRLAARVERLQRP